MRNKDVKILLVEDDPNLGKLLKEYLELKSFDVQLATDGEEALGVFDPRSFDIGIFDVMLPKKDGFQLAKDVLKKEQGFPLIFLTAKALKNDVIEGLKIGADDYITKPFSMEELLLRVNAILKRTAAENKKARSVNEPIEIGKFRLDFEKQLLIEDGGESKKLTHKENQLLKLLAEKQNETLDRNEALKKIWGDDTYFNARSMDVYITKLRKYLRSDESLKIMNIHGEGFKLLINS